MIRIAALNDDINSDENNEDEVHVTKEAEETIAVTEYMRALNLKHNGNKENCLSLLKELLETRVLTEISLENKDDKFVCMRYNCYKNIALIYQEIGEKELALEHFVEAMELDDSEVHIIYSLGKLALELKRYDLAQFVFHKCLARNPNHLPAADGVLQALCATENIVGAYGWAMKLYLKDENHQKAIDVLTEITEKFEHMIPFFENIWKCSFNGKLEKKNTERSSVFPQYVFDDNDDKTPLKPDLKSFRVSELTWLSIAQFITSVYEYLMKSEEFPMFRLSIEDILEEKVQEEEEIVRNCEVPEEDKSDPPSENNFETPEVRNEDNASDSNTIFVTPSVEGVGSQTPQQSDSNAEDSDNPKGDVEAVKKRRRCSDLSFLEQWGWHKNRRYSSRKKSQHDRIEVDTTLNGFLRRIFAKFFSDNFDNQSPFLHDTKTENDICQQKEERNERYEKIQVTYEAFQKETSTDFQDFLEELTKPFDLFRLIFLWLKYVSKYWDQSITEEVKDFYHTIYLYYLNHYDLGFWNQLSTDDFITSFRMGIFFLELDHERKLSNTESQTNEINCRWKMLYNHLMFNSGCQYLITDDLYDKNIIRLIWLDYCSAKCENDANKSVNCLLNLESFLGKHLPDFKIDFPNLRDNNYIDLEIVRSTRVNLQRKISLSNVKTLYDNHEFEHLVEILKDSLINSIGIKNSDNTLMKIQTQFEVLIESLWNLEKYDECLIWCERCLKHAVDNLIAAPTDTYRYKEWSESINFLLIYIEELILKYTYDVLCFLEKYVSRLVQSLCKILSHQLDSAFDKNNNPPHPVNSKRTWIILHQILQRIEDNNPVIIKVKSIDTTTEVEDIEELIPHTFLLLFTAHEFLGRRQWCTRDNGQLLLYTLSTVSPKIRAPYMDAYRDLVSEYLEQITYCLYGYPPKKARSRHIEEHDAAPVELTWTRAIQLFDLYRPENLPEFNSYKLESITADMEQLLLRILPLIPKEIDLQSHTLHIKNFIAGVRDDLPQECVLLPQRISCIYYLLADYYFKNRDFSKTIKYYILDLTCTPSRFDSWAGLALSKASKLETKLNSCTVLDGKEFLKESEDAMKCFEQCIKLNRDNTLLWIEYGSFAYTVHSFCSRKLKHSAHTLSMDMFAFLETRKEQFLKISNDCFSVADKTMKNHNDDIINEEVDSHDEKWLHHYMLGKIAEKRKEHPKVFLDHYLMAANFLYENNATYPIKINHNNPSTLCIEALEIFYRTSSAIIKYLEQHETINRDVGRLLSQVLKDLSNSPFAYNQAKIDDSSINALKRKLAAEKAEILEKRPKIEVSESASSPNITEVKSETVQEPETVNVAAESEVKNRSETPNTVLDAKVPNSSRRGSQESGATSGTSTTGTTSTTSSSSETDSSSSDSDSSDSDSGSSSEEENDKPDENSPMSENDLEPIYKSCIKNLEECVTRFPEHYKSIYRLVNHYLNAPGKLRDLTKSRQLLLGTYTTNLGNQIIGLFSDRKNNNFFNGIWRIPSSEIDRPGSFSSHLVKCVVILLEVLRKTNDHKILIDLALQLHRNPDNDKRYIRDSERKELCQQAISFCIQIMRTLLKQNMEKRDDAQLLNLIMDIYKAHKKCIKHMNQKEAQFTQLLVDAYKFYIEDKVTKMPEASSMIDLAIKLCLQEISSRKNQEKQARASIQTNSGIAVNSDAAGTILKSQTSGFAPATKPVQIPGLPRPRGRPVGSKNSTSSANLQMQNAIGSNLSPFMDPTLMPSLMSFYGNPALSAAITKDPTLFQNLMSEYYKILSGQILPNAMSPLLSNAMPPSVSGSTNASKQTTGKAASMSGIQPPATFLNQQPKVPQFDIKNLIASAASQVMKSTAVSQSQSATISIGSGQLTITPTNSKSSIPPPKEVKPSLSQIFSSQPPSIGKSCASISVTKVPSVSPSLNTKISPPKTTPPIPPPQQAPIPHLPSSLTITTASMTEKVKSQQQKTPQISLVTEFVKSEPTKYSGKPKASKKAQSQAQFIKEMPSSSFPSSPAAQLTNMASLAQQYPYLNNFNLQNYNQQVNLLNTYAELIKSMGSGANPSMLSRLTQFPAPPQKRPYTKRTRTPKMQPQFPSPYPASAPNMSALPIPLHSASSKTQAFTPPFNIPMSQSPAPVIARSSKSPGLSQVPAVVPVPRQSVTPPSSTIHSSPTKTLQQKLAEKQKANALNENSARTSGSGPAQSGKKRDLDIIILD